MLCTHGLWFGVSIHCRYQPLINSLQPLTPILQAIPIALIWLYLRKRMIEKTGKTAIKSNGIQYVNLNDVTKCWVILFCFIDCCKISYWSVCPEGTLVQLAVIVLKCSNSGCICFLRYAYKYIHSSFYVQSFTLSFYAPLLWVSG